MPNILWVCLTSKWILLSDTNQEVMYTNWASVKPEETSKQCVVATENGKWVDVPCEGSEHEVLCYTEGKNK